MGDSDRKVYVGGLAPETTQESLEQYFSSYGDVEDVVVMMDKATNRSRGFGFVTFKSPATVSAAVGAAHHVDGRDITCKKAVRDAQKSGGGGGGDRQPPADSGDSFNAVKIFVGGLPASCDYEKLTEYFSTYGAIKDAVVMMDAQTQRHRGFGYVTFEENSSVEAALKNYSENKVDGKWVEVKRCIPQDAIRSSDRGGGKRGGPDNRGGDRRRDDQAQSNDRAMAPYQGPPPAYGAPPPGYPGYPQGPPPPGYPGADPYAAWYGQQHHYPPPQYGYSPYGYGHYPPPPHHDPYGGAYGGYPPYGAYGPPPGSAGAAVPTQSLATAVLDQRYDGAAPAPEADGSGRESRRDRDRDRQRSVPY